MPERDPKLVSFDLALIGFGNVGRRFVKLLEQQRKALLHDHHLDYRVIGITTSRHGTAMRRQGLDLHSAIKLVESGGTLGVLHDAGAEPSPTDTQSFIQRFADLSDDKPRVVVETTTLDVATGEPAIRHVRTAINSGAHVITTNKGPAAFAYHALRDEAKAAGVSFLLEGTVLDGIPTLNLVRETLPTVGITGFRGVLNSTTNHILTVMEQGGSAAEALAEMQAQGIAEADASLDVEGWDAAAKTAALANVLMDARLTPRAIARTGLSGLSESTVREAFLHGRRFKLVASVARHDGTVSGTVAPVELNADDPLAHLDGQANAVVLMTDLLGEIVITQCKGGLTQTAFGLLTDLVTIRRGMSKLDQLN